MTPVDPLKLLALYTRDIMSMTESQIKFGRVNYDDVDFSDDIVVIDSLTPGVSSGTQAEYDGTEEQNSVSKSVTGEFTLDFFGNNALSNSQYWGLKNETQEARNIASGLSIAVHRSSGVTDLRMLTGAQYNNRFEIMVKMGYTITNTEDLLRIDSTKIEIITDNPEGSFTINTEDYE